MPILFPLYSWHPSQQLANARGSVNIYSASRRSSDSKIHKFKPHSYCTIFISIFLNKNDLFPKAFHMSYFLCLWVKTIMITYG